jgi:hypothetical protein
MGWIKENIYSTEAQDRDDLVNRILIAATNITGQPRYLFPVRDAIQLHCEVYVQAGGGNFWAVLVKE